MGLISQRSVPFRFSRIQSTSFQASSMETGTQLLMGIQACPQSLNQIQYGPPIRYGPLGVLMRARHLLCAPGMHPCLVRMLIWTMVTVLVSSKVALDIWIV